MSSLGAVWIMAKLSVFHLEFHRMPLIELLINLNSLFPISDQYDDVVVRFNCIQASQSQSHSRSKLFNSLKSTQNQSSAALTDRRNHFCHLLLFLLKPQDWIFVKMKIKHCSTVLSFHQSVFHSYIVHKETRDITK